MRKFIIATIIVCTVCLSACQGGAAEPEKTGKETTDFQPQTQTKINRDEDYEPVQDEVNNTESFHNTELVGTDNTKTGNNIETERIITSRKNFIIYREDNFQVRYDIFDNAGNVVLSNKTDRPIKINMYGENLVDIAIGMGTGLIVHKYYCVDANIFSQDFKYVLANTDSLIAYIAVPQENSLESRHVVVQDIFDNKVFYKEFSLDFSMTPFPVFNAQFSSDGASLQLTYLSGEEQTEVTTILNLGT